MPCKNCGNDKTIRAHLIPKVFCKQIQLGNSHATQVGLNGDFKVSQSGLWDDSILCTECDNKLGALENYAHKVFSVIRTYGSEKPGASKAVDGVDCTVILRFCAALLYKFSITKPERGRIRLGRYQEMCRDTAFGNQSIPEEIDAFAFRPIRYARDAEVFAYRAPSPDRKHRINLYRFMIGGMLIFVKLDKRPFPDSRLRDYMLKGAKSFTYLIVPAQGLEEYRIPQRVIAENEGLSMYLDKVAGVTKGGRR